MNEYYQALQQQILPWLLSHGARIVLLIVLGIIARKLGDRFIRDGVHMAVVRDKQHEREAERKRESTLIRIFSTSLGIVIVTVVSLMCLQELGVQIGPILAGAGIVGLSLGFGGQYLIRDMIAGLFIILENQYRIGDVISVANVAGEVEDISLRMTTLRDLDGVVHHVPHGAISTTSNSTKYFARINMNIGVGYNTDLEKLKRVVNTVGEELSLDPDYKDSITKKPEYLRVDKFGDSCIEIKILGETTPLSQWSVAGELRRRIKIAFDAEGIELPYPQLVVRQA